MDKFYKKIIRKRNKEIIKDRKKGYPLKFIANKFNLSMRQIINIIKKISLK